MKHKSINLMYSLVNTISQIKIEYLAYETFYLNNTNNLTHVLKIMLPIDITNLIMTYAT